MQMVLYTYLGVGKVEEPMAKFKPCNYDQLVILPISPRDQLVPGTLEYTLEPLHFTHKIEGGCPVEIVRSDTQYRQDP